MKSAIVVFLVSGFSAAAALAAPTTITLSISGKSVTFAEFAKQHITISASCVNDSGGIKACDAKKALARADVSKLAPDIHGRNPGALLCSEQLGGRVVWTQDSKGNEQTFCQFGDGSFVSSGTLFYYGRLAAKRPLTAPFTW